MSVNCLIFTGIGSYDEVLYEGAYHYKSTKNKNKKTVIKYNSLNLLKFAGVFRVATELRNADFSVQVVDISLINSFDILFKKILKKFIGQETLWIGFSATFFHQILGYPYFTTDEEHDDFKKKNPEYDLQIKEFVKFCLKINPNVKFIIGGSRHFNFSEYGFIHFHGHVDNEIVEFTKNLKNNIVPKSNIIKNIEFLDFHSSRIHYLLQDVFPNKYTMPIEISRGCIFKCKFCSTPLIGKTKGKWIKNYEVLHDEIIFNYENYGIKHYYFVDDTYNDSIEKIENLYKKVFSRLPFKLTFESYIRLDLVYRFPETAHILKESGLVLAMLGIETRNAKIAKFIGKGLDPEKQIEFLGKLHQDVWKNVISKGLWIVGFPQETKESIINFLNWLRTEENPFKSNTITPLGIIPTKYKTRLHLQSEFDKTYDKLDYDFYINEDSRLMWKLKNSDLDLHWVENLLQEQQSQKIFRKNERLGRFGEYLELGVSEQDIINLTPYEIAKKYNLQEAGKKRFLDYINFLLK